MNVTKCSFSGFKCDDLDTLATPNVCKNLNGANTLWAPVVNTMDPPLTCPLKAVIFYQKSLKKTIIDCKDLLICREYIMLKTVYLIWVLLHVHQLNQEKFL